MSDTRELTCPSCGSKNVESLSETKDLSLPFSPTFKYQAQLNRCSDCGMTADLEDKNEQILLPLLEEARTASVVNMLTQLTEKNGMGMARMERALELPQRTMMRWKSGDCSAGALALLRIVTTYPFTIDVADEHFDPLYATRRLAQESVNALGRLADFHGIATRIEIKSFDRTLGVKGNFDLQFPKPYVMDAGIDGNKANNSSDLESKNTVAIQVFA